MRKQRAGDVTEIPLPRRAQSKLAQSAGRSNKSGSSLLLHQKLLPPGPPRSAAGINATSVRNTQFCLSSSSMGVRKYPSRFFLIAGKGRFGKRPPSFTAEQVGPAIDSEDSGFGCDFQSSESQLSWSNDDSKIGGGGITNSTNSIHQPIFSLTSRTLSSSSNLSTSSGISSTASRSSSSPTAFTVPQFSTSSPAEKQFLTNLLHESLAHEDAVDPFDGAFYTTASSTASSNSPASTSSPLSLNETTTAGFSHLSQSSNSPPSASYSPETTVQIHQQPTKVLLIVPGGSATASIDGQPLDFAQVFGKLSAANSTSTSSLVNSAIVNELLQRKTILTRISPVEDQGQTESQQHSVVNRQQQLLASDSQIIKVEQNSSQLPPEMHNEQVSQHSNDSQLNKESSLFGISFPVKNNQLSDAITLVTNSDGSTRSTPTPSASSPESASSLSPSSGFTKLKEILIETSREAAGLEAEGSNSNINKIEHNTISTDGSNLVPTTSSVDPMVILSQAVNLQKELFEEPALDGIPITGKATTINGFGFPKGITTTATATITSPTSVKGLVVDSHLSPSTLVSVQTQQVLESPQQSMKLMQLTENNIRMSPDCERSVAVNGTLPFPVSTNPMQNATVTGMSIGGTASPTNTVSATTTTQSPIPMKRSRFSFAHPAAKGTGLKLRNQNHNQNYMPARSVGKRLPPGTTPTLTSNLAPFTRDGRTQLQIVSQPEEQHRARYQTEGSRGAIKDRKGNGFPTVKLVGYDKPATLQIFIGTDQGKVSPHMFYQACKVTGKSSTPCIEKKVEGTILIEIEFEPAKEMVISCDCVGILKERNVDVEQRFPFHHASQSRKKSTKCRMIFRTTVVNSDGMEETLQVASVPILCTQPPGVPEICKQSITECPAKGGLELFVVGKNFLKDTKVIFQLEDTEGRTLWEATSEPLKDYLQQNHLICVVPPFREEKLMEPVECKVLVVSGGKLSEPHRFMYLPEIINAHLGVPSALSSCVPNSQNQSPQQQQAPSVIPAALVQQMPNGQGLLSEEMQIVNVNTIIPARDSNGMVKSVIVSSPAEVTACSPMSAVSISSPDGSLCSGGSQPSPPAATTTMNPLSAMGFAAGSLIQTPITTADTAAAAVSNFQSVLQQAVQQQQQAQQAAVEQKPVVALMKTASDLIESMKASAAPAATTTFSTMTMEREKPVVTSAIPLDLQFPTQDMPTTEAPSITTVTVSNPFQSNEAQLNCVSIPQIMNGMGGMNTNLLPTTTTSPIPTTVQVQVTSAQQQQQQQSPQQLSPVTVSNDVVMASGSPPQQVSVSTLSVVADCLGQAIIKTEPTPISNEMALTMSNNIVEMTVAPTTHATTTTVAGQTQMGMMSGVSGNDLQPHQEPIANALSQMTDNELINYINPSCFEGPLL